MHSPHPVTLGRGFAFSNVSVTTSAAWSEGHAWWWSVRSSSSSPTTQADPTTASSEALLEMLRRKAARLGSTASVVPRPHAGLVRYPDQ